MIGVTCILLLIPDFDFHEYFAQTSVILPEKLHKFTKHNLKHSKQMVFNWMYISKITVTTWLIL